MNIIRRIRDPYIFEKIYEYVIHFKMLAVLNQIEKKDTILIEKKIKKAIERNEKYKYKTELFQTEVINSYLNCGYLTFPALQMFEINIREKVSPDYYCMTPRYLTLMNFYNKNKDHFYRQKNYATIKKLNNRGLTKRVGYSDSFKFEFLMIFNKVNKFNYCLI
jgi:hypothetical protein